MLTSMLIWTGSIFFRKYTTFISPLGRSFSILAMQKRENPKYTVYGYLPYWSIENIKYLQPDKLTDIAYFGIYLNADGSFRTTLEDGSREPGYDLWKNNTTLKMLITNCEKNGIHISLTVIAHEDATSDKFLNCTACWANFMNNLETELKYHGIKGVNLNFEYVEFTEPETADKYTEFAAYVKRALEKRIPSSKLVISTFADSLTKPRVTKIQELARIADALFIMAYDFHRPSSETAGPVAPIGGAGIQNGYDIMTMLKDYLANSPPNKLILGVPYYGYNWIVEEPKAYATRIEGRDDIGFSQAQTYADIMETILEVKPKILWDDLGQVPYFAYISPETGATREAYFDNADSLKIKYKLAKDLNLAGVGIWALGYDRGYQELWRLLAEEFW